MYAIFYSDVSNIYVIRTYIQLGIPKNVFTSRVFSAHYFCEHKDSMHLQYVDFELINNHGIGTLSYYREVCMAKDDVTKLAHSYRDQTFTRLVISSNICWAYDYLSVQGL